MALYIGNELIKSGRMKYNDIIQYHIIFSKYPCLLFELWATFEKKKEKGKNNYVTLTYDLVYNQH